MKGTGGSEATTTHVRPELWRVPRHELHEVTRALREEHLMAVLELMDEVLTSKVIIKVDEQFMEGVCVARRSFDGHLE